MKSGKLVDFFKRKKFGGLVALYYIESGLFQKYFVIITNTLNNFATGISTMVSTETIHWHT